MSLLKEFLTFSKKDRAGIIALLMVLLLSVLVFFTIGFIPVDHPETDFSTFEKQIAEFESQRKPDKNYPSYNSVSPYSKSKAGRSCFAFDPNTVSGDSLRLLGIYDNIADRIIKYRNSGGYFSQPSDLLKVYGFSEKLFRKIEDCILIKGKGNPTAEVISETPVIVATQLVNLNTADTTELKSLKGIGSKLASRIVKFRTGAGGFYSIEQLTDVYGIRADLLNELKSKITVDQSYQKININTATAEQLKNHPYIYKWNIANAIVNYRTKHGNYKHAADLMKTDLVSDELSRKIAPYLIFE